MDFANDGVEGGESVLADGGDEGCKTREDSRFEGKFHKLKKRRGERK